MPRAEIRRLLQMLLALALLLLIICAWVIEVRRQHEAEQQQQQPVSYVKALDADGQLLSLELEDLVYGVVAAEMPISFDPAALSAQAVAARTYILAAQLAGGRHESATVCLDATCCQAYRSPQQLRQDWGDDYQQLEQRLSQAVAATAGQVLCYQGQPAQTPYHSCCGGQTESAAACWGGARPWLVSVDCGYCGHAARFCQQQQLGLDEAASLLHCQVDELLRLRALDYSDSGRLSRLELGERVIKSTELRQLLHLNSTASSWLIFDDNIVFSSIGYGHGVGLCQYGADGMAKQGYDYQQILSHYYPRTQLTAAAEL